MKNTTTPPIGESATPFYGQQSEWKRVSKGHPCPVCDKPNWCVYVGPDDDPTAAICQRVESSKREGEAGWYHRLRVDRCSSQPRGKSTGKRPASTGKRPSFATAAAAVEWLEAQHGKRSGLWTYHSAGGKPIGVVVRFDKGDDKVVLPVSRGPDGQWRNEALPAPRPLFGMPELAGATRIYVVEGEKCAEAARSLGLVATTSSGGSSAASRSDWSPLAGREVVIVPDNDVPGAKYARDVEKQFAALTPAPTVRIVELPGLPAKGDIVDWLAQREGENLAVLRDEIERLASESSLVEFTSPAPSVVPYRPFPVAALPESIRRLVKLVSRSMLCDPSYVALPLLTVLAAAIGTTRRLLLKPGWSVPTILWTAIVGESGTTKTPPFKFAMKAIRKLQRKAMKQFEAAVAQYEMDLALYEKDLAEWKRKKKEAGDPPVKPQPPAAARFIVSDTTVEALAPLLSANPRGLLLARDELNGWIGSFDRYASGKGGADAAHWLSMHNGDSILVDRKTGVPRTIFVPQAAVCVCGGIQPAILHRALGAEHRESGLAARLLLTCPPRLPKRWTDAGIQPEADAELARLLERLYELQSNVDEDDELQPVVVRLTAEAKSAWIVFYNAHANEQVELTGELAAAWSKLEEYAARLALVIHFIRWAADDSTLASADKVDAVSMGAGIALTEWFKDETRRAYAILSESVEAGARRRLVEWIDRKGGAVTVAQVQRGHREFATSTEAEAAIVELVKAGYGQWDRVETTAQGGRPTRVFRLFTASTVYETPLDPKESGGFVDVDNADEEISQFLTEEEWGDV